MKYEITKGSEKDFEGAPNWAMIRTGDYFYESKDYGVGRWFFIHNKDIGTHPSYNHIDQTIAERRLITEPVVNQQLTTEWDGEGLPPVGTKCEVQTSSSSPWFECEIVYSGDSGAAFISTKGNSIGCVDDSCTDFFRPIRSPEDVARDVATNAFNDIGVMNMIHARQIYDAIAAGKIPGVKLE